MRVDGVAALRKRVAVMLSLPGYHEACRRLLSNPDRRPLAFDPVLCSRAYRLCRPFLKYTSSCRRADKILGCDEHGLPR